MLFLRKRPFYLNSNHLLCAIIVKFIPLILVHHSSHSHYFHNFHSPSHSSYFRYSFASPRTLQLLPQLHYSSHSSTSATLSPLLALHNFRYSFASPCAPTTSATFAPPHIPTTSINPVSVFSSVPGNLPSLLFLPSAPPSPTAPAVSCPGTGSSRCWRCFCRLPAGGSPLRPACRTPPCR